LWHDAIPYHQFVAEAESLEKLWQGVYRTTKLPEWAVRKAQAAGKRYLICITEDWCWDAANTVPVVGKLCEVSEGLELRVLRRDENPHVMDCYLTNGTRSIPVIIVLYADFKELGHWGPRPQPMQEWAKKNRPGMEKSEFYTGLRKLYVKDRGESTMRELTELIGKEG
jgi:hypothetical protein